MLKVRICGRRDSHISLYKRYRGILQKNIYQFFQNPIRLTDWLCYQQLKCSFYSKLEFKSLFYG